MESGIIPEGINLETGIIQEGIILGKWHYSRRHKSGTGIYPRGHKSGNWHLFKIAELLEAAIIPEGIYLETGIYPRLPLSCIFT
ncbi:MAG: hypothetical protein ACE5KE_08100 [Methanosarcinales archaeon]